MYVHGAFFCCHAYPRNLLLHTTFDCSVALKSNKREDSIDVGVLKQILMVNHSELKLVLMKASWIKHIS